MTFLRTQDQTLFKKKGRKECPPEAKCLNCMPKPGKEDEYECWAIKKPVLYKVCVKAVVLRSAELVLAVGSY